MSEVSKERDRHTLKSDDGDYTAAAAAGAGAVAAAGAAARGGSVGVGVGGGGGGGSGVNTHGHKASGRQVRMHTMLDTPPPSLDLRPRLAPLPFLSEMSGFALSPPPRLGKKDFGSIAEFRNLI